MYPDVPLTTEWKGESNMAPSQGRKQFCPRRGKRVGVVSCLYGRKGVSAHSKNDNGFCMGHSCQVWTSRTDAKENGQAWLIQSRKPDWKVVSDYFDQLETTLNQNGLMNRPRQLYNCDEIFIPLDSSKEKAVTLKKAKVTYSQSLGASGSALPPMIIYPKSFPGGQYRLGGPDDSVYSKSDSGWADSELFFAWFKKKFPEVLCSWSPSYALHR